MVESLTVLPAKHLLEVSARLHQRAFIQPWVKSASDSYQEHAQLRGIIGQMHAQRAMEVAAAGVHHLLFCGPPGTGKTMLASRLGGILPPLSNSEAMQVASIHSVAGKGLREDLGSRPFRAPTILHRLRPEWGAVAHPNLVKYP